MAAAGGGGGAEGRAQREGEDAEGRGREAERQRGGEARRQGGKEARRQGGEEARMRGQGPGQRLRAKANAIGRRGQKGRGEKRAAKTKAQKGPKRAPKKAPKEPTRAHNGKKQKNKKYKSGQKRAPRATGHWAPALGKCAKLANVQTGQTGQIWECALPSGRYTGNRLPCTQETFVEESAVDNANHSCNGYVHRCWMDHSTRWHFTRWTVGLHCKLRVAARQRIKHVCDILAFESIETGGKSSSAAETQAASEGDDEAVCIRLCLKEVLF